MKNLKWIFLGLYMAILLGLFALVYVNRLPYWVFPLSVLGQISQHRLFWVIFVLLMTLISQILFVFSVGTVNLCRPIKKRRLVTPVIVTALLISGLFAAAYASCCELFNKDPSTVILWVIIVLNWIFWAVIFFIRLKEIQRYHVLRNLIASALAGSLIELLIAIPAHLIVRRRPGCFVGIYTGIGLGAGITVMLWAFGPGILILLLYERYKKELQQGPAK